MPRQKKLKTNKDKTIFGLIACGWAEVDGSAKYQAFVRDGRKMLVGKSGAMRSLAVGKPLATSLSCTGSINQRAYMFVAENRELIEGDEEKAKQLHAAYLKVSDANTPEMIIEQFRREHQNA